MERALAADPVHRWTTAADLAGEARSALAGSLTAQPTAPVVLAPAVETTPGTVRHTAIVADAARTPSAAAAPEAATRAEAAERRADTRGAVVVTVSVSVILLVWLLVALID